MKKTILIAAASLMAFGTTQAQGLTFAPEVGLNLSSQTMKFDGTKLGDSKMKPGFKIGGVVNIPVSGEFYIQPGIFFSTKGGKEELTLFGMTSTITSNINYIEIPVNALYRFSFGNAGALFVSAGPYAAFAVSGKKTVEIPNLPTVTEDIEFGDGNDEMKRFDFGLNAGIGYETPWGVYIRGQYGFGLANLSPVDDTKLNNQNIQISLGYTIGL